MKIYISGKITGDRRYKAKFREVEKKLAAAGHIVLNPATAPEGLRPVDYMRLCFAMMEAADVVLFMQDYQDSRGAMLEWGGASTLGNRPVSTWRRLEVRTHEYYLHSQRNGHHRHDNAGRRWENHKPDTGTVGA